MKDIEYGVSFGAAIGNLQEIGDIDKWQFEIVEIPFGEYYNDYIKN